jgi:hypothetical protein
MHITAIDSSASAGDFARGQRSDIALGHTDCDFATGMRSVSIPVIDADLPVEENVQLAA